MLFLDWINKAQAREATGQMPIHLLKQMSVHGEAGGNALGNLPIQGNHLLALNAPLLVYA